MDEETSVSASDPATEARVRAWIQMVLRTALVRSARRQRRVRMHEVLESWEEEPGVWLTQLIADDNDQRWTDRIMLHEFLRTLDARERTVVRGMLQGATIGAIATELHVTPRTVRRIRARMRDHFRAGHLPSSS